MKKLFSKKEIFKVKSLTIDPSTMETPSTAGEYARRGMAFYARKQPEAAEADLKNAILLDKADIDSFYGLGMVLKAMDRKDEAVEVFQQVLNLIETNIGTNKTRNDMLRRLALGHINQITKGDWNLEKEIWHRIT
jgi:tetratricopeptide (TPR) repeat protein